MKVFNFLFILLFVVAAALQYNDPDPYLWMPLYLYGALSCFRAVQNKFDRTLLLLGISVYATYAVYIFFQDGGVLSWIGEHHAESITNSMQAKKPWIEKTREFGGLFILLVVLTTNYFWLRKKVTSLVV
ncbi:MAG: transmembrane 220 family protein [Chitinophagaceae bacterium]